MVGGLGKVNPGEVGGDDGAWLTGAAVEEMDAEGE
jgi:hypothetical protein